MRGIIIILVAVIIILSLGQAEDYYILCRPGGKVNVRVRPDKTSPVVGWVEFGRCVHADGRERNGFMHVTDLAAETTDGWVYAGYLVYDLPRDEEYTARVWGGRVIARSCVNGKRLRVLREGQVVTVYARSNAWAVTNKGFVMCDWLEETE